MKKLNGKSWFLLILAGVMLIADIVIVALAPSIWILGVILLVLIVIVVFSALKPLWQMSEKNTHVVEGKFLNIGKFGDGWVGCYFEINGKETRIAITKEVYNPKLLMPGATYKLTLKNKDDSVLRVERIG